MGNRLSKIYTRTGDKGVTGLGDGSRLPKDSLRIEAIGLVDTLNSFIGRVLAHDVPQAVRECLVDVQHDLFDVGADLCTPVEPDPKYPPLRIVEVQIERLEQEIDHFNAAVEDLRSFVLPGGAAVAAHLHVARTVVRRAERSTWAALEQHADTMNPLTAKYLNRLSDLLFVLARYANRERGDVLWVPGANR